jgi:hypothetical protein
MSYTASEFGAMKTEVQENSNVEAREELEFLDQIRNDSELIDRLKITSQELDALSRCALLGTLTCKQDMLFILRQIREAGDPEAATSISQPQLAREEDPVPDFSHLKARLAPFAHTPAMVESSARRLIPRQFGSTFWVLVLVAGLVWNAIIAMSRWSESSASTGPAVDPWYNRLDGSHALLWFEIMFVVAIAMLMYFKTRKNTRHLKVRPGRRTTAR